MTAWRASLIGCISAALTLSLSGSLSAQNGDIRVVFDRTGYRLTSLGARDTITARVLDASRRPVPNASIAYRMSDPNIATVNNLGVVQSRRVGRTRLWAISGTDSASALIMVDQWATTFKFSPAMLSFDAIGRQLPLQVQLSDATGNTIPGHRAAQCRSREDRIATVLPTGQVQSRANGTTWIRCTDKGVSDSVRVDVRQRAARVAIAGKLALGTMQVNDKFQLNAVAFGPANDSIANPRVTWASLVPGVVSIHPLSGAARAIGPGTTRIVTQVGDVTDTVSITVDGTAVVTTTETADSASATKQATLRLDQIYPFVPETATVSLTARDGGGAAIAGAEREVRLTSSNERVVRVLANSRRIVAQDTGTAWLVARLVMTDGTELVDSMVLSPRTRASNTGSSEPTATAVRFERPVFNVDSQRTFNQRQIRDQLRSIVDSGIGRTTTGRSVAADFVTGHVEHETRVDNVSETRNGVVLGGVGYATPLRWLVISGAFRTGTLEPPPLGNGQPSNGEPMRLTEAEANVAVWPVSWFGFGAGYMARGEKTDLSAQNWQTPTVTMRMRGYFIGNLVRVHAGGSIFPGAAFTGRKDEKPEAASFAGNAGLDLNYRLASVGLAYYVERFEFAANGTKPLRRDLFSTLSFRVGIRLGGGP